VWDATTGQAAPPVLVHHSLVYMVAWSPDGTRVATASDDRTARVWDVLGGVAVTPPLAHEGFVTVVKWSPDGTRIATASDDRTARVWHVPWDARPLPAWLADLRRCDYALGNNGALVARKPRRGGMTGVGQPTKNLTRTG
jgi:WD40 repeat protein